MKAGAAILIAGALGSVVRIQRRAVAAGRAAVGRAAMNHELDLRVVTTTPDGTLAAILRGRLESAGIPTMARSYGAGGWLFPGGPSGFGPVDILVPASRLEEAEQILSETDE